MSIEDLKVNSMKWKIRRRVVILTLMFCALSVVYLMLFGEDTRLNETIVVGAFFLAGSTIGSYIFGATWENKK